MRFVRGWTLLLAVVSAACAVADDAPASKTLPGDDPMADAAPAAPMRDAEASRDARDAPDGGDADGSVATPVSVDWTVSLGAVTFYASPLAGPASSLAVLDVPPDVEIRVGTDDASGPVGFHVASLRCHPFTATVRVQRTTTAGIDEVPVTLHVEARSSAFSMIPDACVRLDASYGYPVASTDGVHVALLSNDCRFVRIDTHSMSVDGAPVSVGGPGESCSSLERALDGRLYAKRSALLSVGVPSVPPTRIRLDEHGAVDPSFFPRASSWSTAIDAQGRELVADASGVRRLDEAGNVDPTFSPPPFGPYARAVPFSTGIIVGESSSSGDLVVTRLDSSGNVVVPPHSVFFAAGGGVSWVHELPNGDLLAQCSGLSADGGTADDLSIWSLGGDHRLAPPIGYLWIPMTADDGTLYMMASDPYGIPLVVSMSPNGVFETNQLDASTWTRGESSWREAWWGTAEKVGSRMVFWSRTSVARDDVLVSRVRFP